MAFPPERITVKRRRDEDPVEALFIQQKKQRPSGIWRLLDDENDRPQYAIPSLTSPRAIKETRTTTTAYHSPKVPIVRTTLPSEDLDEHKNAAIPLVPEITKPTPDAFTGTEKRQLQIGIAQTKHPRQKTHNIVASALKARKFHLVNNSSSISSPLLNPKTLAQTHRKSRRKALAVFVERIENGRKANKGTGDRSGPGSDGLGNIDGVGKEDISQVARPRKLPNATAAERKWRAETWGNRPSKADEVDGNVRRTAQNIHEPSSRWDYGSTKLAEQLQEVALEEMRASEERGKRLSDGGGKLKVKPKPPKPRQSRTEELVEDGSGDDDDLMTDTVYLDDEGDYVLDTYVRSTSAAEPFAIAEPAESEPDHDPLRSIDHSNIGILVIENEEEEALWEAFAEDQESDPEWNSEEEDENAEDYYGNDYPEDEVNSDDEFGRGAYDYRHAASDGEEFGWSEDE